MEILHPTKQHDTAANNNNYKISKNKPTTNEDKNNQILRVRYITSTWRTLLKLTNTKKYLNSTSTAEYKTDMNITEKLSSTLTMEY